MEESNYKMPSAPKPSTITPRGRKHKGSRLEIQVSKLIRHYGLDDEASRMVLSGASEWFKGDIKTKLPYTIECKNSEKHQIWKEWEQTESQCSIGKEPVLAIKSNHRPILFVVKAETFLNLLKQLTK